MFKKYIHNFLIASLIPFFLTSCGGDNSTGPNPKTGTLIVKVTTTGQQKDSDGYSLRLDADSSTSVDNDDSIVLKEITRGNHSLDLMEISNNCSVEGENPKSVAIFAEDTSKTTLTVSCKKQLSNKIVYAEAGSPKALNLYIMDEDGLKQSQITQDNDEEINPAISPDGTQIVYVKFNPNSSGWGSYPAFDLHIVDVDGKNDHTITTGKAGGVPGSINTISSRYTPSWSPDGSKIAFNTSRSGNPEIYVIGNDGSNPHNISDSDSADYVSTKAWSKNGDIVFASTRGKGKAAQIFTMDSEGNNIKQLTSNNVQNIAPSWSPDGKRIAFVSLEPGKGPGLYVMDKSANNIKRIAGLNSIDLAIPSWSPDGKTIIYSDESANSSIDVFKVGADGAGSPTNITSTPSTDELLPFWSPVP